MMHLHWACWLYEPEFPHLSTLCEAKEPCKSLVQAFCKRNKEASAKCCCSVLFGLHAADKVCGTDRRFDGAGKQGMRPIMLNSNPETVSTDYDTSSRLYFEPLTVEDVLEVHFQGAA